MELDTNYINGMDTSLSCVMTDAILSLLFATRNLRNTKSTQHEVLLNILQSLEYGIGAYYHYIEAKKPFPKQKYFLFQATAVLDLILSIKNMIHNLNLKNQKYIIWFSILSLAFYLIKYDNNIDLTQNYTNVEKKSKLNILVFLIQMLNQLSSIIIQKNNKDKVKYVILLINAILYSSGKYKLIGKKSFNHNAIWHTGIIIANLIN